MSSNAALITPLESWPGDVRSCGETFSHTPRMGSNDVSLTTVYDTLVAPWSSSILASVHTLT